MSKHPFHAFCAKRVAIRIVDRKLVRDESGWEHYAMQCKLRYDGRNLQVPFKQGMGHKDEPDAADVLYCLLSDASSFHAANGFESWANDLGFDPDSRKAFATYEKVERQTWLLHRFLGAEYQAFEHAAEGF